MSPTPVLIGSIPVSSSEEAFLTASPVFPPSSRASPTAKPAHAPTSSAGKAPSSPTASSSLAGAERLLRTKSAAASPTWNPRATMSLLSNLSRHLPNCSKKASCRRICASKLACHLHWASCAASLVRSSAQRLKHSMSSVGSNRWHRFRTPSTMPNSPSSWIYLSKSPCWSARRGDWKITTTRPGSRTSKPASCSGCSDLRRR